MEVSISLNVQKTYKMVFQRGFIIQLDVGESNLLFQMQCLYKRCSMSRTLNEITIVLWLYIKHKTTPTHTIKPKSLTDYGVESSRAEIICFRGM